VPITAQPIGSTSLTVNGQTLPVRALMLRLTQLFNITGHPAISLPCQTAAGGLPVGLQLVGRRGQTPRLLTLAAAVEDVVGHE
jgi:aspartyl-tRNA(Asn)/glutamyl-tRNA(Gln) amidotransferase subunit A